MGGTSLPTPSTSGYTTYTDANGAEWTSCVCLAEWLKWYERVLLAKGLIKNSIDVWQLTGGATASGNTHSKGGAFDLLYQTSAAHVAVAREMGAPGTWARSVDQGFTKAHTHGVLSGCPHNGPAAYQITAQKRGYNGLGQATSGPYAGMWGYAHKDEFPDPSTYRTWQQGIEWAKAEIARLQPLEEDPLAGITLKDIQNAVWSTPLAVDGGTAYTTEVWLTQANIKAGEARSLARQALARVASLEAIVKAIQANPNITADQIAAAAEAGAKAALDEKIADAVTTLSVNPA